MELDLDDPTIFLRQDVIDDPGPFYDLLRRRAPVWRIPGQATYLVSDPDRVREVLGRPREFSSNLVSLLYRGADGVPVAFELAPVGDPIHVLATADPPVHTRHRRLLQPHLHAKSVASLEPTLARIVEERLAPLLQAGQGDVVANLSDPLPAITLCCLLGLPADDADRIVPLVADMSTLLDGVTDQAGMERASIATLELFGYARERMQAVRERPSGQRRGLLGVLCEGIDTQQLSTDEAEGILVQLFTAGTETTASLIATTIETLARRDELQRHLRAHPDEIPRAIEEVLREDGPFQFHFRWTTTEVTLGGVIIPANSRVLLMWAAANRPSPHEAAPDAPDAGVGGSHLAFGRGLHFCIGAHLARLEARIAIERLLAWTSSFRLDPAMPATRRPSHFLRRHASLGIVVET